MKDYPALADLKVPKLKIDVLYQLNFLLKTFFRKDLSLELQLDPGRSSTETLGWLNVILIMNCRVHRFLTSVPDP
jgi:hypothetical protein